MGIKKITSLKTAFWKFLLMLLAGLAVSVCIPFGIFLLTTTLGITTYADYTERNVQNIAPIIAATPDFADVTLPAGCNYVLLDKNYQVIETSLDEDNLAHAMEYAATGTSSQSWNKQYLLITREKEYVVLQYVIGSQFTNSWLNEHLPSPEQLLYVLIGLNCISVCIILTRKFAKNLSLQLSPLFEATKEVANQNLEFDVGHSHIREFEEVLLSFSHMKNSLKDALEQQWKTEQMQKEQIAALAHDLKTPLTVIQGNADLISETNLDEEQRLYAGYITDSSQQMQLYIKTLIDLSKTAAGYQLHREVVAFPDYVEQILSQADALCRTKNIHLQTSKSDIPQQITADTVLLERAVMNVIDNALDFSPPNGSIHVAVTGLDGYVQFCVSDEGKGFSKEALLHAAEQFYMADTSRSKDLHYGMGLYIASSILQQHGGQLLLENSNETGGARVTLKLPY